MEELNKLFWDSLYRENETNWDIGYPSTPLKEYFDQLKNKNLKILIPGCGNSYEAEYLFNNGFKNVFVLDISAEPLKNFAERNPGFPKDQLINADFFVHQEKYDLIIEQTFFCALNPELRKLYVEQMFNLLKPGGKLAGLLFNCEFEKAGPPFGGSMEEYEPIFKKYFDLIHFSKAYNSIPKRKDRELFIVCLKRD